MTEAPSMSLAAHLNHPASSLVKAPQQRWSDRYIRRLRWTDFALVIGSVAIAVIIRFAGKDALSSDQRTNLIIETFALTFGWMIALNATQSRDKRLLGSGATEYSRVAAASFMVFGFLAIVDLIFKLDIARGFVAVALPCGTLSLLVGRWLWRRDLTNRRILGNHLQKILVVGDFESSTGFIERIDKNPALGYKVAGLIRLDGFDSNPGGGPRPGIVVADRRPGPSLDLSKVTAAVASSGASTVALTSTATLGHSLVRELSWELESMDVDILVTPGVTDIAGPRMMLRPVAGLPMLHIDKPRYEGANRFLKAGVDRVGSAFLLLFLVPLLGACAVAVKVSSAGPIFYRAERIGLGNNPFRMWKFRSMVVDADLQVASLSDATDGNGVLFKMRLDPRVTRVGRFLRRYSLDELPQLINVLAGDMSLVGPRPPLRAEVEMYRGPAIRRLLVRPGITGLWQISGRSDLSWDESVRLDLLYVENWSIMQDLVILWRTMRAVLSGRGAY